MKIKPKKKIFIN